MIKKVLSRFILLAVISAFLYGAGRLYFHLTGGFTLANIQSDFTYHPDWEVRALTHHEKQELDDALNQSYYYLGKGCQSYVFISQDKEYVIKFFKYQRFRLQSWLAYFPPLPAVVKYRQEKIEKKSVKLNGFMQSWKTAFEHLKDETGLIFVHLNKTTGQFPVLQIFDKINRSYQIPLDEMEFCVQKRADMLCSTLLTFKDKEDLEGSKQIIVRLLNLLLSEYHRGLADNDHALMQNTGVYKGQPIHIDVGQFVINEQVKQPSVYHQELFTKTYKFKMWLKDAYPELAVFLDEQLEQIMGPSYWTMRPKFREK